ncbi:MAG TPA: hypothetical protein PLP07_10960 [Pyrinomonadaceae bacterium]|nr:hypothetical protein [Chloracidobacterium sp.]MBP9936673.1 hypothetical protein [Pyrinomonadaceae bacterium]MBK7804049.1 hypothetical protein [Chloracidobacterium sp.]MBK9439281.1 hypothetical protein [Chloracidobacterium sp.]MBK9768751.1 hypothetical protein [Chloracidobacterium sp.]
MTRNNGIPAGTTFSIDTTFVLFFLALEFGQSARIFAFDTLLMSITMLMVLVLPYFLPTEAEPPSFSKWIIGRIGIMAIGLTAGLAFRQSIGVLLPDVLRYVPLTLLIVSAMASGYIQFYGLLKLRPAK